jgi:Trk K+ transport system NAD-binding subunit
MSSFPRRTGYYLLVLLATTLLFTGAYSVGMSVWEGRPRPWYQALEVVVQTFTTTGYGEDAPWQSPQMNLLAILMQLAGIGLILSAVDVFVVPWLRDALRPTVPRTLGPKTDHVLVCGHSPRVEAFIDEMEARDQEYVLVEPDSERARALHEAGAQVVRGDPTSTATLEQVHVDAARVLVADVSDDENASIVLAAAEVAPDTRLITLAEDASLAQYHEAAGADVALSPRRLLGRSLAVRVPRAAATNIEESVAEGRDIDVAELVVTPRGPLHGRTVEEVGLQDRFGVRVVGAWFDGTFETPVAPDTRLDDTTRLFIAGPPDGMSALRGEWGRYVQAFTPQPILLVGYGDTGTETAASLRQTQVDVEVLDLDSREGVDVVGDARDPDVLREAGVETASTLIVAVGDDTAATFVTLIARDVNPDLQILARAQNEDSVQNLYRAGANFVQALPTVCGRMLAATVFEDERPAPRDRDFQVVRQAEPDLAGRRLSEVDAEAQTNYTVVSVVRDDTFVTDADRDTFVFQEGDEVIVAGTSDGLQQFRERVQEAGGTDAGREGD